MDFSGDYGKRSYLNANRMGRLAAGTAPTTGTGTPGSTGPNAARSSGTRTRTARRRRRKRPRRG